MSDGLVGSLAGVSVAVPTPTGSSAHKPLNHTRMLLLDLLITPC